MLSLRQTVFPEPILTLAIEVRHGLAHGRGIFAFEIVDYVACMPLPDRPTELSTCSLDLGIEIVDFESLAPCRDLFNNVANQAHWKTRGLTHCAIAFIERVEDGRH